MVSFHWQKWAERVNSSWTKRRTVKKRTRHPENRTLQVMEAIWLCSFCFMCSSEWVGQWKCRFTQLLISGGQLHLLSALVSDGLMITRTDPESWYQREGFQPSKLISIAMAGRHSTVRLINRDSISSAFRILKNQFTWCLDSSWIHFHLHFDRGIWLSLRLGHVRKWRGVNSSSEI